MSYMNGYLVYRDLALRYLPDKKKSHRMGISEEKKAFITNNQSAVDQISPEISIYELTEGVSSLGPEGAYMLSPMTVLRLYDRPFI